MASLSERLQALEDQTALDRHINIYAHAVDHGKWDVFQDCLTDDTVFEFQVDDDGTGVLSIQTQVFRGRSEVVQTLSAVVGQFAKQQHLIVNRHFDIHGDTADGKADIFFAGVMDAKNPKVSCRMGWRYIWKFQRSGSGWKTAHTKVEKVWEAS